MIVEACPRCKSINNVVSDTKFRMKYKCNWCGDRFVTPALVDIPYDPPEDRSPIKIEKEDYWFDKETQEGD